MYRDLHKFFGIYWREYGGIRSFATSPFLHLSILSTVLYSFGLVDIDWRRVVLSSLPTVLGFSLAAYTITFTLMGSALHRALTSAIDKNSGLPLIRIVNATFFHVVVVQAIALIYAILSNGSLVSILIKRYVNDVEIRNFLNEVVVSLGNFVGCFLSIYSFFLLLSVGFAMFRLGRMAPPVAKALPINDDDTGLLSGGLPTTSTLRFRFLARLAKMLRIY